MYYYHYCREHTRANLAPRHERDVGTYHSFHTEGALKLYYKKGGDGSSLADYINLTYQAYGV